ncbi:MAG: prolyl oligopeptidase family serine peptidase [Candidatus Sericytochromatia bacterium]
MNKKIIFSLLTLFLSSCANNVPAIAQQPQIIINNEDEESILTNPPIAKKIPETKDYSVEKYTDDYSWMKDKSNKDFINYLAQENKYTDSILEKDQEFRTRLFSEMIDKLGEQENSIAEKIGNYYYYQKYIEGQEYPLYYRKNVNNIYNAEELILDLNKFSQGKNISFPGDFKVSPNNKYLAFSIDQSGNEFYTIYIMNLQTHELLSEEIPNTYGNIEWTNDSKYLYYTMLNSSLRPFKIFKHKINTPIDSDKMIYHEKDSSFNINISKTDSNAYILINSESISSNEIRYLGAKSISSKFQVFQTRKPNTKYYLQHNGGKFFVLTNSNSTNYKLMAVNVIEKYRRESWEEIVSSNPNVTLKSFQMFRNYIVIYFREKGLAKIKVYNLRNNKKYDIDFPEPSYTVNSIITNNFNSDKLNISYSSFITPQSIFQYDLTKKTFKIIREEKIRNFNQYNYQTEKINIISRDGIKIPVSLLYRKDMVKNGDNPILINAYGAYGESNDPKFELDKFSLVDRGYIYAIAHIRGGGELGTYWYESGKLLDKKNSINDLIDCIDYLIYQGYISKDRVSAFAKGAGALAVAGATNLRPDLFRNILLEEPFLDILNTMKDDKLPLTIDEYNEWGNPNRSIYYNYIKSYSPYDNIKSQKYPNIFITSGINNNVVGVWESAKYVAKMRNTSKNTNILLKTYTDSGHKGRIGQLDYFKRKSLEYSYILNH